MENPHRTGHWGVINNLVQAYQGTEAVCSHFDMDVLGGAGPTEGDILGKLAEPMGMTDYEAIRIAYKVVRRVGAGFSFYASRRTRPLCTGLSSTRSHIS